MEMAGEEPDVDHRLHRWRLELRRADLPVARAQRSATARKYRIIAAEPEAAPSLTRGVYAYDFGDTAKMTPLVKMHTLGSRLHPRADPRRRPALPRHVAAGQPAQGARARSRPAASTSASSFEAGVQFARAEGILPAPEPTHAIRVAIDEALEPGGRRGAGDPVQPVRPRPFRPVRLRALPRRDARGLRVPARAGRGRAGQTAPSLIESTGCPSLHAGHAAARSTPSPRWRRSSRRSDAVRAAGRSCATTGVRTSDASTTVG